MSTQSVWTRRAPAKINLGLHVLRRRADGFHEVETVLTPIGWADELILTDSDEFSFSCSDPDLPTDGRNLCVRAAKALAEWAGVNARGALHLEKRIPHGAGLGGGSSDAAQTLLLCAESWGLSPTQSALHGLAAELGSDVPFFLHSATMLATGRGERLEALDYILPYTVAVVMPLAQVGTAEAYTLVRPNDVDRVDLASVVESGDLDRWRRELVNDFEKPILSRRPDILSVKHVLLEGGAAYASLSGSGASVFGLFEETSRARTAVAAATEQGYQAWCG